MGFLVYTIGKIIVVVMFLVICLFSFIEIGYKVCKSIFIKKAKKQGCVVDGYCVGSNSYGSITPKGYFEESASFTYRYKVGEKSYTSEVIVSPKQKEKLSGTVKVYYNYRNPQMCIIEV